MGATVSAERLTAAMNNTGIDVDMLADRIQVDVRTVRRWVNGSVPYARHQTRIARALDTTPRDLWPEAHPVEDPIDENPDGAEPVGGRSGRGPGALRGSPDVVAVFPGRDDPEVPDWRDLLAHATTRVDLVDLTLADVITDRAAAGLIAEKAAGGCEVRILISDPDSVHLTVAEAEQRPDVQLTDPPALGWSLQRTIGSLQPLLDQPGVLVRTFVAERFASIVRCDEEMLVTLPLWGAPPQLRPIIHLHHRQTNGVFDRYAHHYDAIWNQAATALTADLDAYPDPDSDPGRYAPDPPGFRAPRPAGFGAVFEVREAPATAPRGRLRRRR
jgi:lambda repressor-like predicted transcriptional regulator